MWRRTLEVIFTCCDRFFVSGIGESDEDMISAIVAQVVKTEAQGRMLTEPGCD